MREAWHLFAPYWPFYAVVFAALAVALVVTWRSERRSRELTREAERILAARQRDRWIDRAEVEMNIAGRGVEKHLAPGEALIDPRTRRVIHRRPR